MDLFKIKELIEQRRNGDKSHSYEIYRLYNDCSKTLRYNLLVEGFVEGTMLDDNSAISSMTTSFIMRTETYELRDLYLYQRRKQGIYSDFSSYKFYTSYFKAVVYKDYTQKLYSL